MKQTPIHNIYNAELLQLIPQGLPRIVEIGCSSGALAREYLKRNPECDYIGVDIDPEYIEVARSSCTRVMTGNIEQMNEATFNSLFPSSCWVFADVLEHLYDPWTVLRRIRAKIASNACIAACIPNAQHWSVQARLNSGEFRYEDLGLLDRTHIRWFTKTTIVELFRDAGFAIAEGGGRVFQHEGTERGLEAVRAFAEQSGTDPEVAAQNAIPLQWLIRAVPDNTWCA